MTFTNAFNTRFPQIHDPAIIPFDGKFLIMGTRRRYAVSSDLIHWTQLHNNLTDDPQSVLAHAWKAWPYSPANPHLEANTWAPDCIWNPVMGKWCQYLSVNGDHYQSVIELLTADHLDGKWQDAGPVIYSGFSPHTADRTDVPRILGSHADLTRYQSLTDTRINAIDAGLVWDENGKLWMNFGSWFGGVWMIQLDPHTGKRDTTVTYPLVKNVSDPYYGIKIAGGNWVSGEGSYIRRIGRWWYLFLSYGELTQRGGYQIRVFRSTSAHGPFVDQNGQSAIALHPIHKNWEEKTGLRLMGSWAWAASDTLNAQAQGSGQEKLARIEVSQGHNSVLGPLKRSQLHHPSSFQSHLVDQQTAFIVYHTRFADLEPHTRYSNGHDYYESRIRELVTTPNGWITAVPFLYQGTLSSDLQARVEPDQVIGAYEIVAHDPARSFDGTLESDGNLYGVNRPQSVYMKQNGSLTTSNSRTVGTWRIQQTHKDEAASIEIVLTDPLPSIPAGSYSGRIMKLPDETGNLERGETGTPRICLSAVGQNRCIWGAKITAPIQD
jgi:arabinan endo-1,5-alpha-L-arabinosidase